MKQQIIVSGLGGQGAVTLTRLLAEAALALGMPVITSETHGMAQRGGTVISMVKVGNFRGPLIPAGAADLGLFLHGKNLAVHRHYLKPGGTMIVNGTTPGDHLSLDALGLAAGLTLSFVLARLVASMSFTNSAMGSSANLMGSSSTDPLIYMAAVLFLYAIAAIAALLPARRAAAIEPMKALRAE